MQTAWSQIWTRFTGTISYDDNHYPTSDCLSVCLKWNIQMGQALIFAILKKVYILSNEIKEIHLKWTIQI